MSHGCLKQITIYQVCLIRQRRIKIARLKITQSGIASLIFICMICVFIYISRNTLMIVDRLVNAPKESPKYF